MSELEKSSDDQQDSGLKPAATTARSPLPDFADIIFLLIIMLLINLLPNFVLGDGSTGWHLYTGQYILSHGQIPHTDLFSYTFPDKHWVPYEWLFDVVAAVLFNLGGIKMVAVATSCALAGLFSLVYYACRKEGCHFLLAMLLVVLGILTSTIHWLARPHLFSFFGVFIFARTLEDFRRGLISSRRLWATLGLTMLVWANAHPAFLIGFGLLGIYLVCETFVALLAGDAEVRKAGFERSKMLLAGTVIALACSFINANAFHLYSYIFQYLHHSYVIANTNEFMPPDFKQLHAICMALLFFAFVVGMFLSRQKIALSPLMVVMAFAWLAINSMRNEPLFVIVSLPIVAGLYADCDLSAIFGQVGVPTAPWFNRLIQGWQHIGGTVDEVESSCDMHLIPAVTTVILFVACLTGGKLLGMELVTSDFDPATKPSTTLAAMQKLPERGGFNLDNWGGYITFKTGRRVFIDDRLDFYGGPFFVDYGQIIGTAGDWRQLLDKHKVDWILMPKNSILVLNLKTSPDWQVQSEDKAAVLLVRKKPLQ